MIAIWSAGGELLNSTNGRVAVSGWRYGRLFIDFRAMAPERDPALPFCWMVSHLPTGMAVIGLLTDQDHARELVEALYPVVDWDALTGRYHRPPEALTQWLDLLPCGWCLSSDTIAPFATVHHPREVAQ